MSYNFDEIVQREGTEAYKLELREMVFGSKDVLPLWVADMDFKAPPAVIKAMQERASHEIYGYTIRDKKFTEAIMVWLESQHQWSIKEEWIEFSPGVLPSIMVAIHEFSEPGDKVIIQTPVYPPFYSIVSENGRELVKNSLVEKEGYYTMDFDLLEKQASDPQTKIFVFSNPHNPVGRAWKKEELRRIADICIKHDVLIVSDEIHSDLCLFGNQHWVMADLFPELSDRIITCMAPSKTFNVAGLSTAYAIITDQKLKARFHKRLWAMQLHMGNLFGGIALEAAYSEGAEWLTALKKYLEGNALMVRDFIQENMPEVGFVLPEATYLLWFDFRKWGLSPSKLKKAMVEMGKIAMNDGVSFGTEGAGFQRMNIGSPKVIIKDGLERILKVRNQVYKH
ncbi:MalY/PatB family protein [Saccharicrinis fermentans]|uniref:cysteine-S-conjugate beta-lyase n=1 Tax=Saccharicrinis fermentans DSM 9555 = JCM 21142 TaxID=869213 RepID=W7YG02_9BACT|nr:PatB family C-S lyase [Saccharicrinis fermentans]GAF03376.1 cystathionine beta-lyase PatB [Saccharicrinis fermentans DSM 9555 = JCM 21142]